MEDLTPLKKDIKGVFEKHDIKNPSLLILFLEAPDHNQVKWVTNMQEEDIKLLLANLHYHLNVSNN